jgi:hypothetical protein
VTGRDSSDSNLAELDSVVLFDFSDPTAATRRVTPKTSRQHHQGFTRHRAKGGAVEVVRMRVRDQNAVDRPDPRWIGRRAESPQWPESRAQQWIGQKAHPVEFDEDRRMADVRQSQARSHRTVNSTADRGVRAARASHVASGRIVHAALESR